MQTHSPATFTSDEVDHLLNYVVTHANDDTLFLESKMKLAAHSDAGCLNENKEKSSASTHMCLSENITIPSFNGAVLTMAKIIKFVMSSAAEV